MLNALSVSIGGDTEGLRRAEASLADQGFVEALRFEDLGIHLRGWTTTDADRALACNVSSLRTEDGFACCVGPLWYRGAFGREALLRLLEDADPRIAPEAAAKNCSGLPRRIDVSQIRGSHAIFLQRGPSAWLWNDAPGLVHVFTVDDGRFLSTSLLAARAYSGSTEIDEDAAIEYVLLGASHSEQTVVAGVRMVPLGHAIDFPSRRLNRWLVSDAWVADAIPKSAEAAAEEIVAHLRTAFREIATAFNSRTRAALSGGFDSRLIVAGLLDQHERPDLFVYGDASSSDVAVARQVAMAEGLHLTSIDKAALNAERFEPGLEELARAARFFDGLPNDGIFDPGADRQTRLAQSADRHIALNGGGGEIFRNFFHLPDLPFHPENIVRAFYRSFDARCLRRPRALAHYQERLASSIARSVGGDAGGRLSRDQIERVYPLFRCHYWMGVNNGIALRSGYFSTPLVDLPLVRMASGVPLAWKNAGALQSRLIYALHSGIAKHLSSYGFSFSDGPDARARRSDWATRVRPVLIRPLISATRRRLQGAGVSRNLYLRYRDLLPGEWRLDPVLDLERLTDDSAFSRALSVEVMARGMVW